MWQRLVVTPGGGLRRPSPTLPWQAQLRAVEGRHRNFVRSSQLKLEKMKSSALQQMTQLSATAKDNSTAAAQLAAVRNRYDELLAKHAQMRKELSEEKKSHKAATEALRTEGTSASRLRKRQTELREKYAATRARIKKLWAESSDEMFISAGGSGLNSSTDTKLPGQEA